MPENYSIKVSRALNFAHIAFFAEQKNEADLFLSSFALEFFCFVFPIYLLFTHCQMFDFELILKVVNARTHNMSDAAFSLANLFFSLVVLLLRQK